MKITLNQRSTTPKLALPGIKSFMKLLPMKTCRPNG